MQRAYKVTDIDEMTYQIDEEGVRFFLLEGKERALLIDSGMMIHDAREIAESITSLPVMLINTHGDIDHIGSNDEFDSFLRNPAEASNYYNTQKRNGAIIPVEDGDKIDLGKRSLEIISIPGHTPGSIAILDEERRYLFSGDPVQDGMIFMFGVQREMHAYLLSLLKLEKEKNRFDKIFPSHGSCPISTDYIMKLHDKAEALMNGKIAGSDFSIHGIAVKRYDTGIATFLLDK